eukprot:1760728-Ditylum_brightwellii.AAC.1
MIKWEGKVQNAIKHKTVGTAKGVFDLFWSILKGDILLHRQAFKHVKTIYISKKPEGSDTAPLGVCIDAFKLMYAVIEETIVSEVSSTTPKTYLCIHIKKMNKLLIKNTAVWLCSVNGVLARCPASDNNTMIEDKLCNNFLLHGEA